MGKVLQENREWVQDRVGRIRASGRAPLAPPMGPWRAGEGTDCEERLLMVRLSPGLHSSCSIWVFSAQEWAALPHTPASVSLGLLLGVGFWLRR